MISKAATIAYKKELTDAYTDFGGQIDCRKWTTVGVWIKADVNSSENVSLKALANLETEATDFEIDGLSVKTLWTTGASDFNKYYEFETGAIDWLQLQAIAGTVGATAGTLTIIITKR